MKTQITRWVGRSVALFTLITLTIGCGSDTGMGPELAPDPITESTGGDKFSEKDKRDILGPRTAAVMAAAKLVAETPFGDIDGNGRVNGADFEALSEIAYSGAPFNLAIHDLNRDGEVNALDVGLLGDLILLDMNRSGNTDEDDIWELAYVLFAGYPADYDRHDVNEDGMLDVLDLGATIDKFLAIGEHLRRRLVGDCNGNGYIDESDVRAIAEVAYHGAPVDLTLHDLNGDGVVDAIDVGLVSTASSWAAAWV